MLKMYWMTSKDLDRLSLRHALLLLLVVATELSAKSSTVTCRNRGSNSSLPRPANDSAFLTLPDNTICQDGHITELYCSPKYRDGTYWIIWNHTAECFGSGNQSSNGSTLTLPCASYTLQCVSSGVHSKPIVVSRDISVGKPHVQKCLEGRHNNVSFFCPALRHEVLRTLWFLGDQVSPAEYISVGSEGSRLHVPCLSKYNNTEVWCQVQLRAGVVNKTVGHISLYPAEKRDTTTESNTKTEATSHMETPQVNTTSLVKIVVIILVIVISLTITLFFLIWGLCNWTHLRKKSVPLPVDTLRKNDSELTSVHVVSSGTNAIETRNVQVDNGGNKDSEKK